MEMEDKSVWVGEGRELIEEIREKAKKIRTIQITKVENRLNLILLRLKQLQDERDGLYAASITKEDLSRIAKEKLQEQKKKQMIEFLKHHFEDCQNHRALPLSDEGISTLFYYHDYWRMIFYLINEKDIDDAVALLPIIGLSEKDRKKKIKKMDEEKLKLIAEIEDEFGKIGE